MDAEKTESKPKTTTKKTEAKAKLAPVLPAVDRVELRSTYKLVKKDRTAVRVFAHNSNPSDCDVTIECGGLHYVFRVKAQKPMMELGTFHDDCFISTNVGNGVIVHVQEPA